MCVVVGWRACVWGRWCHGGSTKPRCGSALSALSHCMLILFDKPRMRRLRTLLVGQVVCFWSQRRALARPKGTCPRLVICQTPPSHHVTWPQHVVYEIARRVPSAPGATEAGPQRSGPMALVVVTTACAAAASPYANRVIYRCCDSLRQSLCLSCDVLIPTRRLTVRYSVRNTLLKFTV